MLKTDIRIKGTGRLFNLNVTLPKRKLRPRRMNSRVLELIAVEDNVVAVQLPGFGVEPAEV